VHANNDKAGRRKTLNETDRTEKLIPFVEEFGMVFESFGTSRMTGRVMGWLLVSDPPQQSAAQLAEVLQASKGSISAATRTLVQVGMVERKRLTGDRKTYYVIHPDVWIQLGRTRIKTLAMWKDLAARGLELLEGEPTEVRTRLLMMHHVHDYFEKTRLKEMENWEKEWEKWKEENR
jgi:DNA-binding transcriptional regulator GbsR (MarR family)